MTTSPSTKKMIVQSLKQLLQTTPLNKITIQNIVDGCHINRQTFYYHFQDIFDALSWMFVEELTIDLDSPQTLYNARERLLTLFEYILENRALCLNVIHSNAQDYLSRFLYNLAYQSVYRTFTEQGTGLNVTEAQYAFVANFYTAGLLNVLMQWIRGGFKESPKDLTDKIMILVDDSFHEILSRYDAHNQKDGGSPRKEMDF